MVHSSIYSKLPAGSNEDGSYSLSFKSFCILFEHLFTIVCENIKHNKEFIDNVGNSFVVQEERENSIKCIIK